MCPECESEKSRVKNTVRVSRAILRYRVCEKCGCVYSTREVVQYIMGHENVLKRKKDKHEPI